MRHSSRTSVAALADRGQKMKRRFRRADVQLAFEKQLFSLERRNRGWGEWNFHASQAP